MAIPETTNKPTAAGTPLRWLPWLVVAAMGWAGGLLAGHFWSPEATEPQSVFTLGEISGLPVPSVAADLHPQYRALLEEAGRAACRAAAIYPTDVEAVAAMAQLHNLAHDDVGETLCWQRCLELDPNYLMAYSALSTRAADKGQYPQAESLLRRAMQVPGASAGFAELLATVLTDQGKIPDAVAVLEPAAGKPGASPQTHVLLGEAYVRLKEHAKAKREFQQAAAMDRSSSRAYHGLAQVAARLGETKEADAYREELARLKQLEDQTGRRQRDASERQRSDEGVAPRHVAQILMRVARVFASHEQAGEAERYLRRIPQLVPEDTASRAALADMFAALGRVEEALAIVEELRRLDPQNVAHLRSLAILQGRLGRWDAARATFRELCAWEPDSAVGFAGLAESYLRASAELPLAKLLADRAVSLEPSAWNYFILGAICQQQRDLAGARAAAKKALALDPKNPRYAQLYDSIKEAP